MRQILENKQKLRQFCANRSSVAIGESEKYNNFELKDQIDQNDEKLGSMRELVENMLKYDPDGQKPAGRGRGLGWSASRKSTGVAATACRSAKPGR